MADKSKGKGPSMTDVSASVAQIKSTFQEIIKEVQKLNKEGVSAKDIYSQQKKAIEDQLKELEKQSAVLKKIKQTTDEKLKSESLTSEVKADYTKILNKAVSLEKQLVASAKEVTVAVTNTFQEEQKLFRTRVDSGKKVAEESINNTKKEKEGQQRLRDSIKEGNARRTEDVKKFESRSREFQNKRKDRLKELGKLEEQKARELQAAAKTQIDIDLQILKKGKMSLEQRRDAQAKVIRAAQSGYSQQSDSYKKLTLRLLKLNEQYEKSAAERDRKVTKGREDVAKKEGDRQKRLSNASKAVFKAELDLSKKSASEKIKDVKKYFDGAERNLRVFGKKDSVEYKKLYAERLRLLKKYGKEQEAEEKKSAKQTQGTTKGGFLSGVKSGFDSGALGKTIGRITGVGAAAAVARKAFQALSKALTGSFRAAVDFEAQLAQLQAVTGINNKELARLEKNVLNVAGSTKFTSQEIVELQTELGKLGFSVTEIESATLAVARTAQALGEKVGPVAQRIGQILNQFNLAAAETSRVSDSLVSVINSSALSFEGFSTALQYIGPLSAEVGTTFEETAVAMALLSDNGFTASRIGTGLRGILTELSTTGKDLNTVVEDLADKEITLAEAVDLVGKRNAAQLITLVDTAKAQKEVGKSLDDLNDKYFNQGSAAIAAAQQVDTFQGNLDLLKSATNRVQIAFGNLLKTSKFLKIALKFIDEEGYNASLAAEAIASADPKVFSDGLEVAAENVGKLKKELVDVKEVEEASREAAIKLVEESIIAPLEEELRLLYEKDHTQKQIFQNKIDEAEASRAASKLGSEEQQKFRAEVTRLGIEKDKYNEKNKDDLERISELEKQIDQRKKEGFEAEIKYVSELIQEAGLNNALDSERNDIILERKNILESLQNQRDKELDTLKQANDFNDKVNSSNINVQEKINDLLAEQEKRKEEGNEIVGEELLLFDAKLNQYKQEQRSLANLVVQKSELEKLSQKEFELEFKRLANVITARKQELADQQSLLDVQIKTQENLSKNAATEEKRLAATKELNVLQVQRVLNEQQAFKELNTVTQEYKLLIAGIGKEISRAGLDDRFLEKAEERLESFKLSFSDLDVDFNDIASATGDLATSLAKTFSEKLSKGIALDGSDKVAIDSALRDLILGLFPAIEEGSEEFNELFATLKPLLMSNLIPDPKVAEKEAEERLEKLKDLLNKIFDELADVAKEYNQTSLDNTQGRLDAELEAVKNRYKVEGEIIKSQLDNQLITESQFRAKQKEIRQKQLAEENDFNQRKFESEKKADLVNIGIETLSALASNVLENFSSFDTISATGLTAVGNAVILGAGALKADAVRRRKFFPVKYEEGGMVQGASHSEGGVPFTVQGQSGYEMEGGEFIVNKKAASLHRGLLEKINNSYKVPTSSSQYKFAAGGSVNAKSDESVDYLKAIAEATTSSAISASKPVRAFVSSKDLRENENERRLRDRNDKI